MINNIYTVKAIETLNIIEIANYICEGQNYKFLQPFYAADAGAQADLFLITDNHKEFVLKIYKRCIVGQSYTDPDGTFYKEEYNKAIIDTLEDYKIEIALSEHKAFIECKNIVTIKKFGIVTFKDKETQETIFYEIMEKYNTLTRDQSIRAERNVLRMGVDIANALATLHGAKNVFNEESSSGGLKGILHSDIKLQNIFYELSETSERTFVLGDFGLSKLKGSVSSMSDIRGGTILTMAPETIEGNFSTKADIYSLAQTMHFLLWRGSMDEAKKYARAGEDNLTLFIKYDGIMPPPENASPELQKLLVNCLEFHQENRNCKSAQEFKYNLQKIQYLHAIQAIQTNDMKTAAEYLGDLKYELKISSSYEDRSILTSLISFVEGKMKGKRTCADNVENSFDEADVDTVGTIRREGKLESLLENIDISSNRVTDKNKLFKNTFLILLDNEMNVIGMRKESLTIKRKDYDSLENAFNRLCRRSREQYNIELSSNGVPVFVVGTERLSEEEISITLRNASAQKMRRDKVILQLVKERKEASNKCVKPLDLMDEYRKRDWLS